MYQPNNLGAATAPAATGSSVGANAATGAAVGTAALPGIGTAVGAVVGAVAGLLGPKQHLSPWGFLYDDYPQHIYENEVQIRQLKNALAQIQGSPVVPMPPMYQKTGGAQYQASMQDIVPKYVPGSEAQIAAYSRTLNEPGGAYERTVQIQLGMIPQLQAQLQGLQQSTLRASGIPLAGSATAPSNLIQPGLAPTAASTYQIPQMEYQPSPFSPAPAYQSAGMMDMSSLGGMAPYILGGVALLIVLMSQRQTANAPARRRTRRR